VRYFTQQHWKYAQLQPNGWYDVEFAEPNGIGGEQHLVRLHVVVKSGVIESVATVDVYRAL
jgi:hypothetical protein